MACFRGTSVACVTTHDFRRTAGTHLAALGIDPHVAERCLNHKLKGVEGIYNRHDYFYERMTALEAWARLLAQLERGEVATVIPIGRRGESQTSRRAFAT